MSIDEDGAMILIEMTAKEIMKSQLVRASVKAEQAMPSNGDKPSN
jgi:hypothetical protein